MDSGQIKIFTTANIPRLRYIAEIILSDILGLSWEITTDKRKLGKNPVINYSGVNISGSFKITPDSLLFESEISKRDIVVERWKELPVFFQTSNDSDLPFDVFAASFFLVSRYEEYLEFVPDEFGRFQASSSLSYKNGFLAIPVVDLWAKELAVALLKKFQNLTFKRNVYNSMLTIDTDQPFAYLGKSLIKSFGGLIRDIKNSRGNTGQRYRILTGDKKDPFEVSDYLTDIIQKNETDARFFFPVGDFSEYDKNPSWKNNEYRELINRIAVNYQTGLHPSFYASVDESMVSLEKLRLQTILQREVLLSRFHYIRLLLPESYRHIVKTGIVEDYSMGYPEEPGFRAGIARPFYFYDVLSDRQSGLKIIPFQLMDSTLYKYIKLNHESSKELILNLIDETRKVGGLFVSIWHNTSLLDNPEGHKWREVFEFMLKNQAV